MSFPPAFLDELRARLPLSDIAGKRLKLTRAGREFKACCPFHNEKTPSFYINDEKQFYHCFGCGAHGDVIGFTMRHDRLSFPEAVENLAAQAGLAVPRDTPVDREHFDREKRLYQLLERATAWFEEQLFAPAGREALGYLRARGLSDGAIRRFRIGHAPSDGQALLRKLVQEGYTVDEAVAVGLAKKAEDRDEFYSFFRGRVIFPVGDRRGRTVAFGGRVLGDGEPKYLNSPDHALFHKGKLLYGLSRARGAIAQGQDIIVAEGYMDVIALAEAGYSGAVAPLGTALTEDQLAILWKLLPPFGSRDPARDYSPILCFDADAAGLRAASRAMERALPLLTSAQTLRVATVTGAKDPDDLIRQSGRSAMDAVLQQARPMVDVIWDMTLAGRQLRTPEERGAFIAALKQRVARIADENLRRLYNDEVQQRLAAMFNWRQESAAGGKNSWQPPRPSAPLINRNLPLSAQHLRERVLLALMINYPELFAEFGEDLTHMDFSTPEFDHVRQQIVAVLSYESPPSNAEELYRHLSEGKAARESLAAILSEKTYAHAGFARSGRTADQARQGWKSIWHKHLQEQLQADLQSAKNRYAQEASDENLTRLLALREQVASMVHEAGPADVA